MHNRKTLCAIILAAGASSRFGANKLLYRIGTQPMYRYIVNLIENLKPDGCIIVTQSPEIASNLPDDFTVVINKNTSLGQSHSMQLGIKAALQKASFDGFLFCTGDQPYLSLAGLQKLCRAWQKSGGICALSHEKRRGSPVIFSAEYCDELMAVRGDTGGRSIIRRHIDELTLVEIDNAGELHDIDTMLDLRK